MVDCAISNRLWSDCFKGAKHYRDVLEKQIAAIDRRDLAFLDFEGELKLARRNFGMSKIAVVNHQNVHRCGGIV